MTEIQVITRLMRYFPDLTWETANDIVETAFVNDVALVRIVNSVVRFDTFSKRYLNNFESVIKTPMLTRSLQITLVPMITA